MNPLKSCLYSTFALKNSKKSWEGPPPHQYYPRSAAAKSSDTVLQTVVKAASLLISPVINLSTEVVQYSVGDLLLSVVAQQAGAGPRVAYGPSHYHPTVCY